MNEATFTASPFSAPRSQTATGGCPYSLWLIAVAACLLMLATSLFWREFYTGDEGFYGVAAQNMLRSPDYILRPSYFPVGDFSEDKGGFAHPPFNSYFYAASLWLAKGSLAGIHVLNALTFAAVLLIAYRFLSRFDTSAAVFAVMLLAASPAMRGYFSMLEAEPLMTAFGLAALTFALRGDFHAGQRRWIFLSGLCLGFSFALKLWLCGPLGLAVMTALAIRTWQERPGCRALLSSALLFTLGGILPSAGHLLAVAAFHPEDLGFWLRDIYFGLFAQAGISGSKLAGDGIASPWVHPVWYYGAALYRDHFFLIPIVLCGAVSLWREERLRTQLLPILAAGLAGLAPLSLLKVKEPLYVLSCAVFLYLLAGACLAALVRRIGSGAPLDVVSRRIAPAIALGLLLLFPLAYSRGIKPDEITRTFVIAHSASLGLFLAALAWSLRRNSGLGLRRVAGAACALAIVAAFAHHAATRHPRDEIIAGLVRPHLAASPRDVSFVASNFKSYQFLTFRRGIYWHDFLKLYSGPETFGQSDTFRTARVFILAPWDLQRAELAPWVRWLEMHATDKTHELDAQLGTASGFRLFVRETTARSS